MFRAWIAHRLDIAARSTPALLRWLEQCDVEIIQAYRSARRSLFAWQLPLAALIAVTAVIARNLHLLAPGHPILAALFLTSLTVIAWPFKLLRLASTSWRKASTETRFGLRLRLLAAVIYSSSAVFAVALLGLAALLVYYKTK